MAIPAFRDQSATWKGAKMRMKRLTSIVLLGCVTVCIVILLALPWARNDARDGAPTDGVSTTGESGNDGAASRVEGNGHLPPRLRSGAPGDETPTPLVVALFDGGPDHVRLSFELEGDPQVDQPITVTTGFVVPVDSAFVDIQGGSSVDVIISLFLPSHYVVDSADPAYEAVDDVVEPGRHAYEWHIAATAGITSTVTSVIRPMDASGRFEPLTFLVLEGDEQYLEESSVLNVRVGNTTIESGIEKLR